MSWQGPQGTPPWRYTCGWCSHVVSSALGYRSGAHATGIQLCPNCNAPTLFENTKQLPGVSPGEDVQHLPVDVHALYKEARDSCAAACYTASVLISRKLLMNIAVTQGAKAGLPFIDYVEHLANAGYVPPNGKGWVDHIRKKGNEATHEIKLMTQADAKELLAFLEMLMKFIYEFPSRVPTATP